MRVVVWLAITFCLHLLRLAAPYTVALPCVALRLLRLKLHSVVASAGVATSVFVVNGADVLTSSSLFCDRLFVLFCSCFHFLCYAELMSALSLHYLWLSLPWIVENIFLKLCCCTLSAFCCFFCCCIVSYIFLHRSAFGSKLLIKQFIYVCMYTEANSYILKKARPEEHTPSGVKTCNVVKLKISCKPVYSSSLYQTFINAA